MKPIVINIDPSLEVALLFLYPQYALLTSITSVTKFIIKKDVCSKHERDLLDYKYSDCIFISTRIFDEVWDKEVIKAKFIDYAHKNFKCRKRTVSLDESDVVKSLIKDLFIGGKEVEDTEVFKLFDEFGSKKFSAEFIELAEKKSVPVVKSAMLTFIKKILIGESSLYYRKKSIVFGNKIRANFIKSYDSYVDRGDDIYGFSFLKFINDLV